MKKVITLFLIIIYYNGINAQCPNGDINLLTQSQINNFSTAYPNCTELLGDLMIQGSSINNLDGLSSISSVANNLYIWYCPNLSDLTGLDNLIATDFLFLNHVDAISDISNFPNLLNADVRINDCNDLVTISGFANLNTSEIEIFNNLYLTSILGFQNTQNISVNIAGNPLLNDFQGFSHLTSINLLHIGNSNIFTNFNQFNNLESIDVLSVYQVSNLSNFTGLENVTSIDRIQLSNNNSLISFSGLDNVNSQISTLSIDNNNSLNDITALNNIQSINTYLKISNSPNLSFCSLNSICNFINIGGASTVFQNSNGCNDTNEILNNCQTSSVNDFNINELIIYPNPSNNFITLLTEKEIQKITIYDELGRINFLINNSKKISIKHLRKGFYIIEIEFENGRILKKFIKS